MRIRVLFARVAKRRAPVQIAVVEDVSVEASRTLPVNGRGGKQGCKEGSAGKNFSHFVLPVELEH